MRLLVYIQALQKTRPSSTLRTGMRRDLRGTYLASSCATWGATLLPPAAHSSLRHLRSLSRRSRALQTILPVLHQPHHLLHQTHKPHMLPPLLHQMHKPHMPPQLPPPTSMHRSLPRLVHHGDLRLLQQILLLRLPILHPRDLLQRVHLHLMLHELLHLRGLSSPMRLHS